MFRFADIYGDLEVLGNLTGQRAMVKRLVNEAVAAIADAHDWPELWDVDFFTTVDDYGTGTVSVTNGSATVTGSGTTFPSGSAGRKFRVSGESAYYSIKSRDSATQLTLEPVYQGTTASGSSYTIYQDEYRLRPDVNQYKVMRQIQHGVPLLSLHPSDFDWAVPTPESTGPADYEILRGRKQETSATGTVSMTSGTRTLTGSGTSWTSVQGLGRGTKLQIGTVLLTVKTVDSDTQITTYEAATSAIPASTSYTAILDNLVVQLFTLPDAVESYYYRFQRRPAILDAEADVPDLPYYLHPLIKLYVLPYLWAHKGFMDRKQQAEDVYTSRLSQMIWMHGSTASNRWYRRKPFLAQARILRPRIQGVDA